MNRRVPVIACLLALLPIRAQAQHNPFPLAPRPNPSASCADPFVRTREEVDPEQFSNDLKLWAINNAHLRQSYVFLNPSMAALLPPGGRLTLNRTTFHVRVMDPGVMGPDELWGVLADCGQLY